MTLYFGSTVPPTPAGGVEKIHQFAATLDRGGVEACVVYPSGSEPMRYWFRNDARSVVADEVLFDVETDVLVIPELWAFSVDPPKDARVIVLTQGAYLTFAASPQLEPSDGVPNGPGGVYSTGVVEIVCVSDDNRRYLEFAFPDVPMSRIQVGIDTRVFHPGLQWRDTVFGFMPRRRAEDAVEVLRLLGARRSCTDWSVHAIEGLDQLGVADALRTTAIFLNLPIREGFPLPALEAMASGCIVVGYTGRGGAEYLTPDVAFPIPEGDSTEFARTIEEVAREYEGRSSRIATLMRDCAELVRTRYTLEKQDQDVLSVFGRFQSDRSARAGGAKVLLSDVLPVTRPQVRPSAFRLAAWTFRQRLGEG